MVGVMLLHIWGVVATCFGRKKDRTRAQTVARPQGSMAFQEGILKVFLLNDPG